MTKLKTVQSGEVYRSITGELRVLEKKNKFVYRVELWLLNEKVTENDWLYLNLEEHRTLFAGVPILTAYVGEKIGDGHNFRTKRDKNGEEYASFLSPTAERIVGSIPDDETQIRIENRDGNKWIVATGYLWTWYAHELVDKIASQGRGMSISIETLIQEMHMSGTTEVYDKYIILGVTILGDGVRPAVSGADIRALSAEDGFKELKVRAASYIEKPENSISVNSTKGKKPMSMKLNKTQLAELEAKFNGYSVVGASDDGMNLCLLSKKDGCIYGYTRNAADGDVIIESRITPLALNSTVKFGEEDEIAVDILAVNEASNAEREKQYNEACTARDTALNSLNEAQEKIKNLTEKETTRRKNEVVNSLKAVLAKHNAESEDRVDEKDCEEIFNAADDYAKCEDEKGDFCGAEKACSALKAKLYDRNEAARERKNAAKNGIHSWIGDAKNNGNKSCENSDEALIARLIEN